MKVWLMAGTQPVYAPNLGELFEPPRVAPEEHPQGPALEDENEE